MLIEEYKELLFNFLSNFYKYNKSFELLGDNFKKFNWNRNFIIKFNETLSNQDIINLDKLNIFKNTNIKEFWEDVDEENKKLYSDDLQKVISLGKLIQLNNVIDNDEEENNSLDNFELIEDKEINMSKLNEKIENLITSFVKIDKKELESKLHKIYEYVNEKFNSEIKIIKDITEKEETFINDIVKKVSNVDMSNINFDIKDFISVKNKNQMLEKLINNFKSGNPDIQVIVNDVMMKFMEHKNSFDEILNNNEDNMSRIKDLVKYVMNTLDLKSQHFDFINLIMKNIGFKEKQRTNEEKKLLKEKRRKRARCNYRKKLKNKMRKKNRKRNN